MINIYNVSILIYLRKFVGFNIANFCHFSVPKLIEKGTFLIWGKKNFTTFF